METKRPLSATLEDSARQLGQCSMVVHIAVLSILTYGDSETLWKHRPYARTYSGMKTPEIG